MSDTKVVVELAGVNLPLGQFMELACKRMTLEMAHETHKWEALDRLSATVKTQSAQLLTLQKRYEMLENTVDTLFKVVGVGRQRQPNASSIPSITDEED